VPEVRLRQNPRGGEEMIATTDTGITLKTTECYFCGCTFGMPKQFYDDRLNDHKGFYCPNGHCQHFIGKTEAEKLRDELRDVRVRNMELYEERDAAERSRRATKGQLTKLRKRIDNGVCPYCSRHFSNVQKHIATKHKEAEIAE
jgi:DNA repair exonuclease SbcCD ATPase subunit